MGYCSKCGAENEEDSQFCVSCGAPIGKTAGEDSSEGVSSEDFTKEDVEKNKAMGILAYLSWLVLIPLLSAKDSKYAKFHTNQGLVLAITELIWWIGYGIISKILWSVMSIGLWGLYSTVITLLSLVNIIFVVLLIVGIMNACSGKAKELPVIGKFRILK